MALGSRPFSYLSASSSSLSQSQRDDAPPGSSRLRAPMTVCHATGDYAAYPSAPEMPGGGQAERMGEAARKALGRATRAMSRYGWISFWVQLTLSVVSAVILLFSVAFTSQSGPRASLYLTLLGILAGFLSTFWNFGYTRTAKRMQAFLDASPGEGAPKIKKQNVRLLSVPHSHAAMQAAHAAMWCDVSDVVEPYLKPCLDPPLLPSTRNPPSPSAPAGH